MTKFTCWLLLLALSGFVYSSPIFYEIDESSFRGLRSEVQELLIEITMRKAIKSRTLVDETQNDLMSRTDPKFFQKLVEWVRTELDTSSSINKHDLLRRLLHDNNIYCCPFGK